MSKEKTEKKTEEEFERMVLQGVKNTSNSGSIGEALKAAIGEKNINASEKVKKVKK
jgi:hypothetical protein